MAGREKKTRISPFSTAQVRQSPDDRTEEEQLFEEANERMDMLEHDAVNRDREYQKAFQEVVESTQKGHTKYSASDKLRAALAYIVTASSNKAHKLTGIPSHTIRQWKSKAPWWPKAVEYALLAKKEELDANLQEIQDRANHGVIDRIQNGDHKLNKFGEVIRLPIGGKELMTISAIARDKQSLLRGQPTSISEKVSESDRLDALADKITKAVQSSGKVIEGVVVKDGDN